MHGVFFIHVWPMSNGKLAMIEIEGISFHMMKQRYRYHFPVFGETATVHTFFNDYDIREKELKKMATAFVKGSYNVYSVELYGGKMIEKRGIPKVYPR